MSAEIRRRDFITLIGGGAVASTYLSGTNTRRVRRALKALFGGAVSKDTVSRLHFAPDP